jgi:hypothetical protein
MSEYIFVNRGDNRASAWSVRRRTAAQRMVRTHCSGGSTGPPGVARSAVLRSPFACAHSYLVRALILDAL